MSQSEASAQIMKNLKASDHAASMLKWRQDAGIVEKSVRIDVRLDQPVDLILRQLDALSVSLAEAVKSARKLDNPQDQISLLGSALKRERYKLKRGRVDG